MRLYGGLVGKPCALCPAYTQPGQNDPPIKDAAELDDNGTPQMATFRLPGGRPLDEGHPPKRWPVMQPDPGPAQRRPRWLELPVPVQ
ncbi:hypothetical protein DPEC_G00243630 [Dallia pectoralis]|uniref:Uncharacterized protein n=1 Tax=Dallia pectoralis TaxID=75939 RepID=A0ACC2FVC3_DALPE|nr:hypothetical protein DPEC_G00243630 [Dallia pectoralis]